MKGTITPLAALAFETVRHEASGQISLVGSMSNSIGCEKFPTIFQMEIVAIAKIVGVGDAVVEFGISTSERDETSVSRFSGKISAPDEAKLFPLGPREIEMDAPGKIRLAWRQNENESWQVLRTWDIVFVKA